MDKKTLEHATAVLNAIDRLKRIKEKLTWYVDNERRNKTSLVGFATTSTKMLEGNSIIEDSIYPIHEIMDEYSKRIDNKLLELQTELDLL